MEFQNMRTICAALALLVGLEITAFAISADHKRSTPALELLRSAEDSDARLAGDRSFQLRANVKLEQGKGVETEGTYVLQWSSVAQWREEFSFADFSQIRVSGPNGVWEKREPTYLSLRLWQLMQALSYNGRFQLQREERVDRIRLEKRSGARFRCIDVDRNSDGHPIRELCFRDDSSQLIREHYVPSDRTYEFSDYLGIGTRFFPGHIRVFEGKVLAADFAVTKLGELNDAVSFLEKPSQAQWRLWCTSPEAGGDPVTPIYSRSVLHNGVTTLYAVFGPDSRLHDVHILESGGAEHDSEVLKALERERWNPTLCEGKPIMTETVFRR